MKAGERIRRMMKNIFKNKFNKGNPFENGKGDKKDNMDGENQEITEENTVSAEADDKEEQEAAAETESGESSENSTFEQLQAEYDELNSRYIRLAADFENFRKRQAQEREALISFGAQECLKKILEIADNFDRASGMIDKIDNIDKMKETFLVLNKQLEDSMAKLGLERIKCEGELFDPNLHEAVMQVPTDEYPEDTIINELQKVYKYQDKVLRPAMVSAAVKKQ